MSVEADWFLRAHPEITTIEALLPDCNGVELCKKFNSDKKYSNVPIIIITSLNTAEDKIRALAAGAADFLNKPIDREELYLKINNHLLIRAQYKEIRRKNDEINEYIELIAHDLKNPLTVIIGYNSLVANMVQDTTLGTYLDKTASVCRKMQDSINRILDRRRINSATFQFKYQEFDIGQMLREIYPEWEIQAKLKGIEIKLENNPHLSPVMTDKEKFKDIIDNLVNNAIKYSFNNTSVTVAVEDYSDKYLKVLVNDNGQGLTLSDKEEVFGHYRQLSAKPTGNETSTGLGLSIVKRLVESMEGEVGVDSAGKNMGASFWFTIKKIEPKQTGTEGG